MTKEKHIETLSEEMLEKLTKHNEVLEKKKKEGIKIIEEISLELKNKQKKEIL